MIISFILVALMCDSGVILWGEFRCSHSKGFKKHISNEICDIKIKVSQRQIEGHENATTNCREHPIFVLEGPMIYEIVWRSYKIIT